MKRACPAPAAHHSTRQWLIRSDGVLPPSWLSRMNEFSPVINTSLGSTGGVIGAYYCTGDPAVAGPARPDRDDGRRPARAAPRTASLGRRPAASRGGGPADRSALA